MTAVKSLSQIQKHTLGISYIQGILISLMRDAQLHMNLVIPYLVKYKHQYAVLFRYSCSIELFRNC